MADGPFGIRVVRGLSGLARRALQTLLAENSLDQAPEK